MNYRELIYKNALELIKNIYLESKYNPDVDLYRSFDILNSINENQFNSKEWLVDTLIKYVDKENIKRVLIGGSWYGLIGIMLREHLSQDVYIRNVDYDGLTKEIGKKLAGDNIKYKRNEYYTEDIVDFYMDKPNSYDLIINTSCEHMESDDIRFIVDGKPKKTIVCLQSNNYHEIQSHINTHNSLEEFIEDLNLPSVYYAGTLNAKTYDRYMVIGR